MASAATASMNVAHERHSPLRRASTSNTGLPPFRASSSGTGLPLPVSSSTDTHRDSIGNAALSLPLESRRASLIDLHDALGMVQSLTSSLEIRAQTGSAQTGSAQTGTHTTLSTGRPHSPTPPPIVKVFPTIDGYPEESPFITPASITQRLAAPPPIATDQLPGLTARVDHDSRLALASPSHASSGNRTLTPNSRNNSPGVQRGTPVLEAAATLPGDRRPRSISPSKQIGAVLPESSSSSRSLSPSKQIGAVLPETMLGYAHLFPMLPIESPPLPARVIRAGRGSSGGWALLRASAKNARFLLASVVLREWMVVLLRKKYTGPLTWIRHQRTGVMHDLSSSFHLQALEGLLHMFLLQWRLAVAAPSTQLVLEALEARELGSQRGSRLRAQQAERCVARRNGALEFLLMMLDTHRLERMLHNSLRLWQRNVAAVVMGRREMQDRYRLREIHITRVDVFASNWLRQTGKLICKQVLAAWSGAIASARETAAAAAEAARQMGHSLEAAWSPQVAHLRKQHRTDVCGLLALNFTTEANHLRHACLLWWLHLTKAGRQEGRFSELFFLNAQYLSRIGKTEAVVEYCLSDFESHILQHWLTLCWQAWLHALREARLEVLRNSHAEKTIIIDDQRSQLEELSQRTKEVIDRREITRACIHCSSLRHIQRMDLHLLNCWYLCWRSCVDEARLKVQLVSQKGLILTWLDDAHNGAFSTWLARTSFHLWWADTQRALELNRRLVNSRKKNLVTASRHIFLLHSDCDSHLLQGVLRLWITEVREALEVRQREREQELRAAHRRRRRTTHEQFFSKFEMAQTTIVWQHWQAEAARNAAARRLQALQADYTSSETFREDALNAFFGRSLEPQMLVLFFEQWAAAAQRSTRRTFEKSAKHHGRNAAAAVLCWGSPSQLNSGHAKLLLLELLSACLSGWCLATREDALAVTTKRSKALSKQITRWTAHTVGWRSLSLHEFRWSFVHAMLLRWGLLASESAHKRRLAEQEQQHTSTKGVLQQRHEAAVEDLQQRWTDAVQGLRQRHDLAVEQLQLKHTTDLEDMRQSISDTEALGTRQLEESVGELKGQFHSSVTELQDRLAASDTKHREWERTLEQRLRRSHALTYNLMQINLLEQAFSFQKVIWERWREAVAESRELGLRSLCESQHNWHRDLHDAYSQSVHNRNEVLRSVACLELSFRLWFSLIPVSRRDTLIKRWRAHHHNVLQIWYSLENRVAAGNCLTSWRQVVDRIIKRRGMLSLEQLLEKTRSRDYGLLSNVLQAWCATTAESIRAFSNARHQKAISLRQQIERRWMGLRDELEELVFYNAWVAWVNDARYSKQSHHRNQAEARLASARVRGCYLLAGIFSKVALSWWLSLWHITAQQVKRERHGTARMQALRQQRFSTTEKLQHIAIVQADTRLLEVFFRALLSAVAAGRAARMQHLRQHSFSLLAGELQSARISALISMLITEWRYDVLLTTSARRYFSLADKHTRTLHGAHMVTHKHHLQLLLLEAFGAWKQSTHLQKQLGNLHDHGHQQLTTQRLFFEDEIAQRHRQIEESTSKHLMAVHAFVEHKMDSTMCVALRAWRHSVSDFGWKFRMTDEMTTVSIWNEMHCIFSLWYCVAKGERHVAAEESKTLHLLETALCMIDRHTDMQGTALRLTMFHRWAGLALGEAYVRGAGGIRDQMKSSIQSIVSHWDRERADSYLMITLRAWKKCVTFRQTKQRRRIGLNIFVALGRQEDIVLIRAYFAIWAGVRLKQIVSRTLQTSAELTHWASLQLLARHALSRWMGLVLMRREIDAEAMRLGVHSKIGACGLLEQVEIYRASDMGRAILAAWLRLAVKSGRLQQGPDEAQLSTIRRRALYAPADMMTARMLDVVRSSLLVTTWYTWVVAVCNTNVEAHTEVSAVRLGMSAERQEFLIGLTLLVWGQEQSLSYARSVLAAWCYAAVREGRDAQLRSLTERALQQAGDREVEHTHVSEELLRRYLASSDRESALSCLLAWHRTVSDALTQRGKEERQSAAQERGAGQFTAWSLAQHAMLEVDSRALVQACFLRWHCIAVRGTSISRELRHKQHRCAGTGSLLDSMRVIHIGLLVVTALRAWCAVAAASSAAAALFRVQKDLRRESRRRVVKAGAGAAHLEDGVLRLFCFMGWRFQATSARVEARARGAEIEAQQAIAAAELMAETRVAEARAVEAVSQFRRSSIALCGGVDDVDDEDLEVALFGVPLVRCFQAWRLDALGQKRERLQQDVQLILGLLQQASNTIEDMRVRFLLVRMYGVCRREVLLSWRQAVDAEHTARLVNKSLSGSERAGLVGPRSIQAAAHESSRGFMPLTTGSQASTPSRSSSHRAEPSPDSLRLEPSLTLADASAGEASQVMTPIMQLSPSTYPSSAAATPAARSRLVGAGRADIHSTELRGTTSRSLASGSNTSVASIGVSAGIAGGQAPPPLSISKRSLSPPHDRSELVRQLQQVRNAVLEKQSQASTTAGNAATQLTRSGMASLREDTDAALEPGSAKSTLSEQY